MAAELLLSEDWATWQVAPLAVSLAAPFVAGTLYAIRAVRHGNRRAWVPLLLHLSGVELALAMPISESLAT